MKHDNFKKKRSYIWNIINKKFKQTMIVSIIGRKSISGGGWVLVEYSYIHKIKLELDIKLN